MATIHVGDRVGSQGTLRVGCSAVIFDESRQKILLTKREDNGQWCLPSGGMNPGEDAMEACTREVEEETGLQVRIMRLIGHYTTPNQLIEYRDGNKIQLVALCYEVEVTGGALRLSDETTSYGYFSRREITALDIMINHVPRIDDAFTGELMPFLR